MNLEQPRQEMIWTAPAAHSRRRVLRVQLLRGLALVAVLLLLGSARPSWLQQRNATLAATVAGYGFNLVTWERDALLSKAQSAWSPPAAELTEAAGIELVRAYIDRAQRIRELEAELSDRASTGGLPHAGAAGALQEEMATLRTEQQAARAQVEQVIEWQVRDELARAGLTMGDRVFPPVQFTFTEPPKKLIVSPRDRIEQTYYRMLVPDMPPVAVEAAEARIFAEAALSAYITPIGGLGAYPAMVIDRASLPWILSTVAHEWVHNYLTLAPLGVRYNLSPDLTTMNETVAEIVGNEIGARVLRRHYPELVPTDTSYPSAEQIRHEDRPQLAGAFDFAAEMRETRLEVDRLLAAGEVEAAEAYMEARRQLFVENGYPLRVLNQAYFAFHGAYGTSPASTDPIGPKLFQLRNLTTDVADFLTLVRSFTSVEDLEAALAEWQKK